MMITASHNPAVYNGIKVFTKGGRDADELQTQEIERYIHGIEEEVLKAACVSLGSEAGEPAVRIMEYEKGIGTGIIEEINPDRKSVV